MLSRGCFISAFPVRLRDYIRQTHPGNSFAGVFGLANLIALITIAGIYEMAL
jgi:hypothetical protein